MFFFFRTTLQLRKEPAHTSYLIRSILIIACTKQTCNRTEIIILFGRIKRNGNKNKRDAIGEIPQSDRHQVYVYNYRNY